MDKLELNIFQDKKALKHISWIQIISAILAFIICYLIEGLIIHPIGSALIGNERFGLAVAVLIIIALFIGIIIVHESIHGLFFKLFNPSAKVNFGFKAGMAYATSPGTVYTRLQFLIIILMPFLIITTIMVIMMFTLPNPAYKYYIAIHAGACAGDFYYAYLILKHKHLKYAIDTEVGMSLYESQPAE
ncbi:MULTISPECIES: DUF3267 domain-containing protein [Jeotgalicoccus]|uniref:DUF3267 domain-containing protein n=1 Tax=Jeotgalicoccus TaxID=227979 RepID=UPI000418092A|nr:MULTISPECIES: DUF3267 domain-containing protein [Jeotgalicoccus]